MFVALAIQHAQRMRRIILSFVACPAVPHFYTLSQHDFLENIKCVVRFSIELSSETLLILRTLQWEITNVHESSRNVPDIPARFYKNLIFRQIFEKYLYIKFHEKLSRGSRVFQSGRTDRQTYMTRPIVAFRSFVNAPTSKKGNIHICIILWHSGTWHCVVFCLRKFQ